MKKLLALLLILSATFIVGGAVASSAKLDFTSEETTEVSTEPENQTTEATTEAPTELTAEETTTDEIYCIRISLNQDYDFMIEKGYAFMEDDCYIVAYNIDEILLDWGDIPTEEYYYAAIQTCDMARSYTDYYVKCDRETAEKIHEIISSKECVGTATLS